MVQELTTLPSASTRFAQGLAQSLPEEIKYQRMKSGLNELANTEGLTPRQNLAKAGSVYGISPQLIQSFGQLAQQEARGKALEHVSEKENVQTKSPFSQEKKGIVQNEASIKPSLTTSETIEKAIEGFIPRTEDQKLTTAGQKYNANPALYSNNPQMALDREDQIDATNQAIANSYLQKHENLSKIQDNVVNRLNEQSKKLETQVPAEFYSAIEDEAIQATKPKKEGGRGLTEQQAIKEFGDKLNDASRDFKAIEDLGGAGWGIVGRRSKDTLASIKGIQKRMEDLDQTDNAAKLMIAQNKITPQLAYATMEPVSRVPELNNFIKSLPSNKRPENLGVRSPDAAAKTLEIAPQLAQFVKNDKKSSPLAIAYELEKLGYDGSTWLQYFNNNINTINPKQRQAEQGRTPLNVSRGLNDFWLESFTGIE
jgi:hypothetical protein